MLYKEWNLLQKKLDETKVVSFTWEKKEIARSLVPTFLHCIFQIMDLEWEQKDKKFFSNLLQQSCAKKKPDNLAVFLVKMIERGDTLLRALAPYIFASLLLLPQTQKPISSLSLFADLNDEERTALQSNYVKIIPKLATLPFTDTLRWFFLMQLSNEPNSSFGYVRRELGEAKEWWEKLTRTK